MMIKFVFVSTVPLRVWSAMRLVDADNAFRHFLGASMLQCGNIISSIFQVSYITIGNS